MVLKIVFLSLHCNRENVIICLAVVKKVNLSDLNLTDYERTNMPCPQNVMFPQEN